MKSKTTKRRPFLDEWNGYRKSVYSEKAPDWFLDQCKLAFYAGAFAFIGKVMPKSPDEDPERMMAAMDEIRDFCIGEEANAILSKPKNGRP